MFALMPWQEKVVWYRLISSVDDITKVFFESDVQESLGLSHIVDLAFCARQTVDNIWSHATSSSHNFEAFSRYITSDVSTSGMEQFTNLAVVGVAFVGYRLVRQT